MNDFLLHANITTKRDSTVHSHASKILLKVIHKRMEQKLENEISETQTEFRKNEGTRDQIFVLKIIIQKFREYNKDSNGIYLCFVYYAKAFDSVVRSQCLEHDAKNGLPKSYHQPTG